MSFLIFLHNFFFEIHRKLIVICFAFLVNYLVSSNKVMGILVDSSLLLLLLRSRIKLNFVSRGESTMSSTMKQKVAQPKKKLKHNHVDSKSENICFLFAFQLNQFKAWSHF